MRSESFSVGVKAEMPLFPPNRILPDFSLKYDDLKVVIYKGNKRVEKNKFLSAIGNLIVKDDSNKELKTVKIEVKRNQEKSFYNFLWISIADGLKQILL